MEETLLNNSAVQEHKTELNALVFALQILQISCKGLLTICFFKFTFKVCAPYKTKSQMNYYDQCNAF